MTMMSMEATIIAMKYSYLIRGSGGTGKCTQNYVVKYTVNKMATFNINFYSFLTPISYYIHATS